MTSVLERSKAVLGSTEPRLYTKPLRPLTPETSAGFEAIEFITEVIGKRLLPWQRWWLVHVLELNPDGTFRFKTVLTLVSRQNGKTWLLGSLVLWFLFVRAHRITTHAPYVLCAAQDLATASKFWDTNVGIIEAVPELAAELPGGRTNGIIRGNGKESLLLNSGAQFVPIASTRSAARGKSTDLLVVDELREQRTTDAWAALQNTTVARANSLKMCISNQGDDESVVLNNLRSRALAEVDPTLGLFEWSAEDDCDPDDIEQWAKANPALGRTLTLESLQSIRSTSSDSDWRTENLCQRVDALDNAVDPIAWRDCRLADLTLAEVRDQIVACVDVSVDYDHVTLALAAPIENGRIGVEVAAVWDNADDARRELPEVLAKLTPRALAWFPGGTAGVLSVEIAASHGFTVGRQDYLGEFLEHSPGVIELSGRDVTVACQTLSDLVRHRQVRHRSSPMLDAHISSCSKYDQGETGAWRFARKGFKPIDAAYAAAGAVHLARSLPAYKPMPRSEIF